MGLVPESPVLKSKDSITAYLARPRSQEIDTIAVRTKLCDTLTHVKLILLRFLLVRAIYNGKYYSELPFEKLYKMAIKEATRSRGLDVDDFYETM